MDYRYIDWNDLLKGNLPCLFKSVDGHPIIFYFCIENSSLKQKLEELVIRNGGDTVEKYFEMNPMTVLMVDEKSMRNFYNRVSFKTSYIIDCVKSGCLHNINKYIHNDVSTTRNCDYMDVIFFRKHTFYDGKPCFCCKRNYNVAKNIRSELPEINSLTGANIRCDSNYKTSEVSKEQSMSLPNHLAEGENAQKTIQKCLNPCSHCSLQANQSRPSISSHPPSNTHSFVRNNENRFCLVSDENPNRGKSRSTYTCRSSRECYNEPNSSISDNELGNLQYSPDYKDNSDSDIEDRTIRVSDNDSDLCRKGRRRNVVISDDDSNTAKSGDCNKTNLRTLAEDEDDIGPPISSTSRKLHIPDKHTRKLYSRKEKEAMLKYIIKHDAIECVKGMVIWKRMERSNICPQRTWMSMQNHFKKSLCKELDQFAFLTPSQKKALRG